MTSWVHCQNDDEKVLISSVGKISHYSGIQTNKKLNHRLDDVRDPDVTLLFQNYNKVIIIIVGSKTEIIMISS